MTTTEYLQREIRHVELSIRRAERKPNTPPEELRGLNEKLEHLRAARAAVGEHWQRVHDERGWMPRIDLDKWTAEWVKHDGYTECSKCEHWYDSPESEDDGDRPRFCPECGRAMTPEAWAEMERRFFP